jgi:hypothetical protein
LRTCISSTEACPRKCRDFDCGGPIQRPSQPIPKRRAAVRPGSAIKRLQAYAEPGCRAFGSAGRDARVRGRASRIAPRLIVLAREYILNPFDIATLGTNRLGDLVGSFIDDEEAKRRIQDALDAILKPY